MVVAPITFIVLMTTIALALIGWSILAAARRQRRDLEMGTLSVCPHCQLLNPTHARFCGHCGKALN